jgi:hypothetical protein
MYGLFLKKIIKNLIRLGGEFSKLKFNFYLVFEF